eukprot:TRINITY_DN15131_c0_g1_i1.p1 TRINITY_DN15131_c0_g1~~TRINITY_DN15131_c0_g1_i1.p1  ORF type:complete len:900 (+),score=116.54 TRINITY_DN15131_c0_g1_i1:78-2702(+)
MYKRPASAPHRSGSCLQRRVCGAAADTDCGAAELLELLPTSYPAARQRPQTGTLRPQWKGRRWGPFDGAPVGVPIEAAPVLSESTVLHELDSWLAAESQGFFCRKLRQRRWDAVLVAEQGKFKTGEAQVRRCVTAAESAARRALSDGMTVGLQDCPAAQWLRLRTARLATQEQRRRRSVYLEWLRGATEALGRGVPPAAPAAPSRPADAAAGPADKQPAASGARRRGSGLLLALLRSEQGARRGVGYAEASVRRELQASSEESAAAAMRATDARHASEAAARRHTSTAEASGRAAVDAKQLARRGEIILFAGVSARRMHSAQVRCLERAELADRAYCDSHAAVIRRGLVHKERRQRSEAAYRERAAAQKAQQGGLLLRTRVLEPEGGRRQVLIDREGSQRCALLGRLCGALCDTVVAARAGVIIDQAERRRSIVADEAQVRCRVEDLRPAPPPQPDRHQPLPAELADAVAADESDARRLQSRAWAAGRTALLRQHCESSTTLLARTVQTRRDDRGAPGSGPSRPRAPGPLELALRRAQQAEGVQRYGLAAEEEDGRRALKHDCAAVERRRRLESAHAVERPHTPGPAEARLRNAQLAEATERRLLAVQEHGERSALCPAPFSAAASPMQNATVAAAAAAAATTALAVAGSCAGHGRGELDAKWTQLQQNEAAVTIQRVARGRQGRLRSRRVRREQDSPRQTVRNDSARTIQQAWRYAAARREFLRRLAAARSRAADDIHSALKGVWTDARGHLWCANGAAVCERDSGGTVYPANRVVSAAPGVVEMLGSRASHATQWRVVWDDGDVWTRVAPSDIARITGSLKALTLVLFTAGAACLQGLAAINLAACTASSGYPVFPCAVLAHLEQTPSAEFA